MPRPASAFGRLQAAAQLTDLPVQEDDVSADLLQARSVDMLTMSGACPAAQSQLIDLQSCESLNPAHTSDGSVSEGMIRLQLSMIHCQKCTCQGLCAA